MTGTSEFDPTTIGVFKARVVAEVELHRRELVGVVHRLAHHPELMFEEHASAALLADTLEAAGFLVRRGVAGLATAFEARCGFEGPGPCVAILCEYDALPGLGHACGHNVIAAAGLGAGLAAASVVRELGGELVVFGTPAEEGGGGKVTMLEAGLFADVDAVMMVHPAAADLTEPEVIAISTFRVDYRGVAAHAAAAPWLGRNALDAAVLGYNAVAALRQHIEPNERIHGVFPQAGEKPNIVPDHTVAEWYVRSPTLGCLAALVARVMCALEAGASAAGCSMEVTPVGPTYSELRTNEPLLELYRANSAARARPVAEPTPSTRVVASTDAGNVSRAVPTIHPMVKIAPSGVSLHSAEFATWADSVEAERGALDGAAIMAMTAVDLWGVAGAMADLQGAFQRTEKSAPVRP